MDVNQVFSGDSLKAADLQGREVAVVISNVEMKKFDNGNKLVLHFEGKKKTLISNKTNAKRIANMYGANTDGWIGQEITLYTDHVEFQGELVDAIRVKVVRKAAHTPPQTSPQRMAPVDDQRRAAMDDEIPF